MPVMDTLAKRLAYARAQAGLSQKEVAERSGLKQSDVSKIEGGQILKTTGMVGLARAVSCNPFWLDDGSGDPYAEPGWPFELFNRYEYNLVAADYRKRIENELAGEVQRVKKKTGTSE